MDPNDFYEGLKTDRETDREHVDAAEHFVRLKQQAGLIPDQDAELEKEAASEEWLHDKITGSGASPERLQKFQSKMDQLKPSTKTTAAKSYATSGVDPGLRSFERKVYQQAWPKQPASRGIPREVKQLSAGSAAKKGMGRAGKLGLLGVGAVSLAGAAAAKHHLSKEKRAGLPEPTRGDLSPRSFDHEGSPAAGMDQRKGYNFTAVHHEGKNHILIDHHSSGRVGHLISHPETGAVESSEIHPSHKHMAVRFHEHAAVMNQHLNHQIGQRHGMAAPTDDGLQKLASLLRARLHKQANMMGGASSPSLNGGIKPIQPVGGGGPGPKPPSVPGMGGSSMTGGSNAGIGKLAEGIDPEIREAITAGPPKIGYGTLAMHLIDKMTPKSEPPKKHKGKTKKAGLAAHLKDPRKVIPAAIGAVGFGGGTYLSAKPRKHLGGRSKAEAETELHARANQQAGERGAGYFKKMKNRLTEFNHGSAKAQREHPLKAALSNGAVGAALGLGAARALGGKKR